MARIKRSVLKPTEITRSEKVLTSSDSSYEPEESASAGSENEEEKNNNKAPLKKHKQKQIKSTKTKKKPNSTTKPKPKSNSRKNKSNSSKSKTTKKKKLQPNLGSTKQRQLASSLPRDCWICNCGSDTKPWQYIDIHYYLGDDNKVQPVKGDGYKLGLCKPCSLSNRCSTRFFVLSRCILGDPSIAVSVFSLCVCVFSLCMCVFFLYPAFIFCCRLNIPAAIVFWSRRMRIYSCSIQDGTRILSLLRREINLRRSFPFRAEQVPGQSPLTPPCRLHTTTRRRTQLLLQLQLRG